MDIQKQIERAIQKKVIETAEKVTRKVIADIDNDLVSQTPVDTGRAQNNWLPSINTPRNDTISAEAPRQQALDIVGRLNFGETFYITNNLPYIRRLNDGYSKQQATPSWVEATVQRNARKGNEVIREVVSGL